MEVSLADDVFMAARDEDLVVLDARSGDYLCLPDLGCAVTLSPDRGRVEICDAQVLAELTDLDLLSSAGAGAPRALPPAPRRDAWNAAALRLSAGQVADLAATSLQMLRLYRGRSFPELVRIARRGAAGLRQDPASAVVLARAFRRGLPWIPFQGDCLFRSTFLRTLLRRRGLDATWVIGVQTWPFEAHCWLQVDDLVLDDAAEHAAAFTPLAAF